MWRRNLTFQGQHQHKTEYKLSENKFQAATRFPTARRVRFCPALEELQWEWCPSSPAKSGLELAESEQSENSLAKQQNVTDVTPQASLVLSSIWKKCEKISSYCQLWPLQWLKMCIYEPALWVPQSLTFIHLTYIYLLVSTVNNSQL